MQIDSQMLLFGALILLVSFLLDLIVAFLVRRSIKNDRMSKMITMQQAAFRTESAATLDRMRTTAKECQQDVEMSTSQAEDMVRQISDSLKTLSDYQEDLAALQSVCAEYKSALEKLRIATDQAEARISAVQQEVRKVEAANERMDSFRGEAERSMNQLQDLKAEYVRLVAATQESLRSAAETQKAENQEMLSSFQQQIDRAKELFGSFVTQERMDFKAFADSEMKKAEDQAVDTENRRDSIIRSLEEGKAELEAFRSDLSDSIGELSTLRDSIKSDGEEASKAFEEAIERKKSEAADAATSSLEEARSAIDSLIREASIGMEKRKDEISDGIDALSGRLDGLMKECEGGIEAFIQERKGLLESDCDALAARFGEEKEAISSALASFESQRTEAAENTNAVVQEALRSIESARLALDGERSSFIEASKDAVSKSFSDMLEGVNQRYERMKGEGDAFVKAIADRINDTRETITLLSQGEQERIQDSVERLQELDRKIRSSEEQLQKLSETITASREELFSVQQDRGRLDSEIEERNKTLSHLNDEMQKSKSARISEEAALVRLKLQISNLEKERKQSEMKKADEKAEKPLEEPGEKKEVQKKPEEMIEEFPDDIFTGNVEEIDLDDED